MIPQGKCYFLNKLSKPRASGDDPGRAILTINIGSKPRASGDDPMVVSAWNILKG